MQCKQYNTNQPFLHPNHLTTIYHVHIDKLSECIPDAEQQFYTQIRVNYKSNINEFNYGNKKINSKTYICIL